MIRCLSNVSLTLRTKFKFFFFSLQSHEMYLNIYKRNDHIYWITRNALQYRMCLHAISTFRFVSLEKPNAVWHCTIVRYSRLDVAILQPQIREKVITKQSAFHFESEQVIRLTLLGLLPKIKMRLLRLDHRNNNNKKACINLNDWETRESTKPTNCILLLATTT